MQNKKNSVKVNKDFMIRVRVTEDERNQFWKLAMEKGYKSVSDYIRGSVTVQATPGDATAGKTLLLSTDNTFLISIPESVTFDASGIATIPVNSLLPGEATITFTVEGTTITGSVTVISTVDGTEISKDNTRTPGDVNGDGEINVKDVVVVRRYIAGGWNSTIDESSADVNGDGEVNVKDVVLIRRYIAEGWNVELK